MEILNLKIADVKPYEKNPRKNEEAVIYVANSIKDFGFKVPIVIDKDNVIVCGHTRYKAAKKLGLKEVPCIMADDLTDEQIKAYRLADNKVAEKAEWDFDILSAELEDLFDFDMANYGFNIGDEQEPEEVVEDEFETELPEQPKAKLGDIYQLGRHRLMCGDSTSITDVEKLMNGEKADMVFTDPPYGMKKEKDGVANDNLNFDDLLEFNKQWIPLSFLMLKENGSWYCWGIDEPLMDIYSEILKPMKKNNEITFRNLITWEKESAQGQLSEKYNMYPVIDEKCLFVMNGIQDTSNNRDRYPEKVESIRKYLEEQKNKCGWDIPTMKTIAGHSDKSRDHWTSKSQWELISEKVYIKFQKWAKQNNVDAFKKEYNELKKEYEELRTYFDNTHDIMSDVWHFNRTTGQEKESAGGHATPKPIALCCRAIKSSSRENENVLDFFGGSGSTLIACEQLKRNAYLMELEPKWVDVIIQRWEQFTGLKAELISG